MMIRRSVMFLITAVMAAAPAAQARTNSAAAPVIFSMSSRAYLGVNVSDVSSDRVAPLKLKEERGVEVTMVDQDSPAGKAGMKEHDVILDFNGNRVEGTEQLTRMIRETPPGRVVTLGISRDGQPMQLKVTLGDRSKELSSTRIYNLPHVVVPDMPDLPEMPEMPDFNIVMSSTGSAGALVENLTPQLGDYFGVKGGAGVLVRSVEKGSAAESAGMKAGDVIVKAEGEKIENRSDWHRALRARKNGKISVTVVRDKREQGLTLTLPAPRHGDSSAVHHYDFYPDVDIDLAGLDELREIGPQILKEMDRVGPQIQKEMDRVGPQIQKEMDRVGPQIQQEMKRIQPQLEQMQKDIQRMVKDIKIEVRT